ncbi:MAG: ROK family protein [Opitutales bacterium]|nr:ROK family protein [Opitutales bacterium]
MNYAIGLDVGGSRIKSGAVTAEGLVGEARIRSCPAQEGPEALLATLVEEVRAIRQRMPQDPVGIGLGLSGAVEPKKGSVYLPGKFKDLEHYPLVPKLAAATGFPAVAENDARAVLMAEMRFGKIQGCRWAVSLTIGTGFGSAVLLDGRILRDPQLQFGTQLGHLVIQGDGGKLCLSNAEGTGESLCSATALAMAVRDGLQRGIDSCLAERYFKDPQSIDFSAVIEGYEAADRLCVHAFKQWRRRLVWILVNAVHAYAPERIVIGGGGAHASAHYLDYLRDRVPRHLFRSPQSPPVAIEASDLIEDAGILGSAVCAFESHSS